MIGTEDWYMDEDIETKAGGDIRPCSPVRALAQSFLHELSEWIGTRPWDNTADQMETEVEGARILAELDQDLNSRWLRRVNLEIKRLARKPRWRADIQSARLAAAVPGKDGITITIELTAMGETARISGLIGG